MQLIGKNHNYKIISVVNKNDRFTIYKCVSNDHKQELLAMNGNTNKNEWILNKLKTLANKIDEEQKDKKLKPLNYHIGFPNIIDDGYIRHDGSELINDSHEQFNDSSTIVIEFPGVEKVESIIPLVKFWKSGIRVDLRSSAWIFGKLLKTISFAHENRIQIGKINGNNVLIQPDLHYVIVFDWSFATIHANQYEFTKQIARDEIKLAAELIIKLLGDNLENVIEHETDRLYIDYISQLSKEGEISARKAHTDFYQLVDKLCSIPESVWEPGFYKFTTHSIRD